MYYEIYIFVRKAATKKSIWKDGDIWTSAAVAVGMYFWMRKDHSICEDLRGHFSDILTFSSIILGFVLTTLVFYLPLVSEWRRTPAIQRAAERIIDWHVWTVLWVLLEIILTVGVQIADGRMALGIGARPIAYTLVIFTAVYACLQLVNHALTIWWVFQKRDALNAVLPNASNVNEPVDDAGKSQNLL